ncbi:alpha/beta fold hydrolase [Miniphocaeibacter halophilus]|uniref:Alpha/beta fold hydrolase n=1 Tax=Miniphocaeibacter halophilus TaxID=2931922 RepID=A0AC61MR31_9FIRM|nr:alpha/beta fold hydrolase [Miniphocaeibacter halophilus]QQK06889.1 alpha/beta fold hydrolase [Miniphocaeibacter halophilus]
MKKSINSKTSKNIKSVYKKLSSKMQIKYLLIPVSLIFILSSCLNKNTNKTSSKNYKQKKSSIPTLYIHGYKGTENSFGKMINRFEEGNISKKELVLKINKDGEIIARGKLTNKNTNPAIQILFEDNKNNEYKQATWIKNILAYLKDKYNIEKVNLVGHSMGGVSILQYLITYEKDENLPKVEKFVAIGSPFNNLIELSEEETLDSLINNGPLVKSKGYIDFENNISNINPNINILIIAGDVEDGSLGDEAVPMADALSIISLLKNNNISVDYKKYYGKNAQHSKLHENKDVDKKIIEFLY